MAKSTISLKEDLSEDLRRRFLEKAEFLKGFDPTWQNE